MLDLQLWVTLAFSTDFIFGARILAVLPIYAKSHHVMFNAVLTTLAERGHQVVNFSPFPPNEQNANHTHVTLNSKILQKPITKELLDTLMTNSPVRAFDYLFYEMETSASEETFQAQEVKELLKSNDTFDLIILEPFYAQESLVGLGHKYKAPIISLQPIGSYILTNRVSGNDLALAHIPCFTFSYSNRMSFYERFLNSYLTLSSLFIYYTTFLPKQDEYMRTIFKDPTMPPLVDMLHNISLFVSNAHPTVHYAQPYSPNMIAVGGIHISKERKPLPIVIKKFLDEATHGVVYMSLGSMVPDHILPAEFSENFLHVFKQLPQRVLWKTDSLLSNLPDNVMTAKWTPQQDVLAHPNIVLFITQGGLFSQHETIYAGVPVVCIPIFGDHALNAKFFEERNVGITLPFNSLSEKTIQTAVLTVLNNPKYRENMKRQSRIYHDQPSSPADNLVYWVEYVMRHGGAPHLRPASSTLSWYQLALLDILATVVATAFLIILVIYLIFKKTLQYLKALKNTKFNKISKKRN